LWEGVFFFFLLLFLLFGCFSFVLSRARDKCRFLSLLFASFFVLFQNKNLSTSLLAADWGKESSRKG